MRMRGPLVGVVVGAVLGLGDGLSAWLYPEARPMLAGIVVGSTIKGVLTGLATAVIARRRRSLALGVGAGAAIGFVLSSLAAMGQPDQYFAIVLPGMLVGAFCGFITQRYAYPSPAGPPHSTAAVLLSACLLSGALSAGSQATQAANPLDALEPLIGQWKGTAEGQPGKGVIEREYRHVLGSRFIQVSSRAVYPPKTADGKGDVSAGASTKGEEHEDLGIFSFDRARRRVVFRQFHIEGFVNRYVMAARTRPDTFVFTTEAIENIPPGWKARETYTLLNDHELEEIFELAEPGKPFEVYSRARLERVVR